MVSFALEGAPDDCDHVPRGAMSSKETASTGLPADCPPQPWISGYRTCSSCIRPVVVTELGENAGRGDRGHVVVGEVVVEVVS